jgi:hypothetical protein
VKKFIIALFMGILLSTILVEAKPKKEVQSVAIPQSTMVYEGVTKSGNPKYWIEVSGVKVSISKSNAEKLKRGEKVLLVKWVDENGKYSYSTRCETRSGAKPSTPNLDLSTVRF